MWKMAEKRQESISIKNLWNFTLVKNHASTTLRMCVCLSVCLSVKRICVLLWHAKCKQIRKSTNSVIHFKVQFLFLFFNKHTISIKINPYQKFMFWSQTSFSLISCYFFFTKWSDLCPIRWIRGMRQNHPTKHESMEFFLNGTGIQRIQGK